MRTTLDIDDDVLRAAQELARRERSSAGRVISRLARDSLVGSRDLELRRSPVTGLPLLPGHAGIVTNELIDRIREEEGV